MGQLLHILKNVEIILVQPLLFCEVSYNQFVAEIMPNPITVVPPLSGHRLTELSVI